LSNLTAIWKPAWYVLDQSITVGEIDDFELVRTEAFTKFATALEEGEKVKGRILKISNFELGNITKIDASGLSYKFYTDADNFFQIEAEETPSKIEGKNLESRFLEDTTFSVEIELL
jgi:hypothetical protein